MFEKVVAKLVDDYFGLFVEIPHHRHIDVSVLSGKATLRDLPVRPDAVNAVCFLLGLPPLPVRVKHGTVAHIEVDVPIRKRSTKPIDLVARGVTLVLGLTHGVRGFPSSFRVPSSSGPVDKLLLQILTHVKFAVHGIHVRFDFDGPQFRIPSTPSGIGASSNHHPHLRSSPQDVSNSHDIGEITPTFVLDAATVTGELRLTKKTGVPSPPASSKTRSPSSLFFARYYVEGSVDCTAASVWLDQVLRVSIRNITGLLRKGLGRMTARISVWHFNTQIVAWEPVVEPWDLVLSSAALSAQEVLCETELEDFKGDENSSEGRGRGGSPLVQLCLAAVAVEPVRVNLSSAMVGSLAKLVRAASLTATAVASMASEMEEDEGELGRFFDAAGGSAAVVTDRVRQGRVSDRPSAGSGGAGGGAGAGGAGGAATAAAADSKAPTPKLPQLKRMTGESMRAFARRVNEAAKEEIVKQGASFKKSSERHKQFLNRKKERAKEKRLEVAKKRIGRALAAETGLPARKRQRPGAMEEDAGVDVEDVVSERVSFREDIKFGERTEAPPDLATLGARLTKKLRKTEERKRLLMELSKSDKRGPGAQDH